MTQVKNELKQVLSHRHEDLVILTYTEKRDGVQAKPLDINHLPTGVCLDYGRGTWGVKVDSKGTTITYTIGESHKITNCPIPVIGIYDGNDRSHMRTCLSDIQQALALLEGR